jgi:RecA DNA recombination protein
MVRDPEIAAEISAHLVSLERLSEDRGRRATGLAALDALLGGGWPRAALSEISGRRSSGRTAVVRAALAAAISAGESTALVDVGGTLDARAALSTMMAPGPPLLWIRCGAAQALKATDLVVAAGGFGTVALDLCDARLRIPDAAWMRLRHAARAQGTTVLVASGARRLGAFAAAAVDLGGAPAFDPEGPPLFARLEVRAQRLRNGAQSDGNQQSCVSLAFTSRS